MRMFAKLLLTVGLMVAGGFLPALAQRGGARGGLSGGARGGFSGMGAGFRSGPVDGGRGFAPSGAARAYALAPRMGRPTYAVRPGYAVRPSSTLRPGYAVRPSYAVRPGYSDAAGRRVPYPVRRPVYTTGYVYPQAAWFLPDDLAYPFWEYDDDDFYSEPVYDVPQDNYVEAPPPADADDGTYPQQPPQPTAQVRAQAAPEPEDVVALVFKDGRPNEYIRNYMLTPTTLTVVQGHRMHDVAIADLDLAATEKVNRAAGVAFKLPGRD